MRIIPNNDLSVQPLSEIEREVFYFIRNFRNRHEVIFIPLTNIAARFKRCTRTIKRILKSLLDKGLIERTKRGWGQNSITRITEKGENFVKRRRFKMSPQMSPQQNIYLRSKSLKGSNNPLPPKPTSVVENKVVELPKLIGKGFVKSAEKVLGKIASTLRAKVVREFDAFAEKHNVRSPIAFLRHKINQLSALEQNAPVLADRIAVERLQNELKAKAQELAKDELKQNGKGYPAYDPEQSPSDYLDAINAYGMRESEAFSRHLRKLEAEYISNNKPKNETKHTNLNCSRSVQGTEEAIWQW